MSRANIVTISLSENEIDSIRGVSFKEFNKEYQKGTGNMVKKSAIPVSHEGMGYFAPSISTQFTLLFSR